MHIFPEFVQMFEFFKPGPETQVCGIKGILPKGEV